MKVYILFFFLVSSFTTPQILFSQAANLPDQYFFQDWYEGRNISPHPFINGYSSGMGQLEFIVQDSTRDAFLNPSKFYKTNGTRILFSPSMTVRSLNVDREQNTSGQFGDSDIQASNTINNQTTYTTLNLPLGFLVEKGDFYAGGLVTFTDYQNERFIDELQISDGTTISSINFESEETLSGTPVHFLAGYHFFKNFTISVTYKRTNLEREQSTLNLNNQLLSRSSNTFKSDFMGTGVGVSLLGGQSYFLGGIYQNRSDVENSSNSSVEFWEEVDGVLFEYEHVQPVSPTLSVGAKLYFDKRNYNNQPGEMIYDGYSSTFQTYGFGTGLNKKIATTQFGIELLYHLTNYNQDQLETFENIGGSNEFIQDVEQNYLVLRAGMDTPILPDLRFQAGFQHTFMNFNLESAEVTEVPSEDFNLSVEDFNKPFSTDTITRFTSGLFYKIGSVDLIYSLNIEMKREFIVYQQSSQNEFSAAQVSSQLGVSYRF